MVLYKYATAHSGFKIIEQLRLKVTPPNEFNDPFELTPRATLKKTLEATMLEAAKTDPEHFRPVYDNLVKHDGYPGSFDQFRSDLPTMIQHHFKAFKKLYRRKLVRTDLNSVCFDARRQHPDVVALRRSPPRSRHRP